ncbi:MAG: aminoacetone oxidase family FAD-binding enzyme, partial [Bacilli bacterium]|nr:aminoacetone oxidase family FAD-binding enzyme [Bacilli bacterium]
IYNILKELGHTVNPILPSLTPLIVEGAKKYNWSGIRTDATLTLISDHKVIKEERGELQLTNEGISGIVTVNISGYASRELAKHKDVSVQINFLPDIKDVRKYLDERAKLMGDVSMNELLNSLLNYKLAGILFHFSHIDGMDTYQSLSDNQLKWLINNITSFECNILDTESFSRAQVCTGGVSLSEINPQTMESTIISGLYITGEILDVDGECGGYNLAFAFITGYLAGKCLSCLE